MWDVAVVGAGPAGAAAALAVKAARQSLSVLLLDRCDFPRDKACGDGVAPHVLDVLTAVGVTGLLDDIAPVSRLQLSHGSDVASRCMARPAFVVPRRVLDSRLVDSAVAAGAVLRRHRVRSVRRATRGGAVIDDTIKARVVIGADGASSVVRGAVGVSAGRRALGIRGYAPTPDQRKGQQVIAFGRGGQPAYAWSFDRGDGLANVGYGELLSPQRPNPTRAALIDELERLLPGATTDADDWLGHHLPLSARTWRHPDGPVLLTGDAAGLINPMTGEGIYYAVATGMLAGRAGAAALAAGDTAGTGARYRVAVRGLLARHLRHTDAAARLASQPAVARAAVRAAARDQWVFDDLVEVGLGPGLLTAGSLGRIGLSLAGDGPQRARRTGRRAVRLR